jgi:hypothetical protein
MEVVPIVSVLSLFVIAPAIVFTFIYMSKKSKLNVEEMRYKRDMMALELEKDRLRLQLMEAENAKYDRIIADSSREKA